MSTIEKALQKQKEKAALEARLKTREVKEAKLLQPQEETVVSEKNPAATTEVKVNAQTEVPEQVNKETTDSVSNTKKIRRIELKLAGEDFVSDSGRRLINEEYRAIKRKVLSNAFGPLAKTLNNCNIIMVSSPNPNEGKTFTAINLALSIALERDKTVLLVDADVLRPSVMKTIGQPFENGLMEYLLDEVSDLSEVIYHTSLDTLKIIPAGKSHHLSSELLASRKMLETVVEFSNRYPDRVVIFDTPPLLGINETAILANLAGQAIIVVEEGKTNLNRVSKAVEQLNTDMAKGFVVNKSRIGKGEKNGYYGYYYGSEEKV